VTYVSSGRPHEAASPLLGIDIQRDGRTTILWLTGELDLATADELRRHVLLALDRHDPDRLLLDLSELSFTDSSGLAAMVWAHQLLTDRGRQLRLRCPRPLVRRALYITGLHTRLHITEAPPARGAR
jgi:anti-anti-sigma factor